MNTEEILLRIERSIETMCNRFEKLDSTALKTYEPQQVCDILRISKRKFQSLRDEGKIRFSQDGNIIRCTESDILDYLERHKRPVTSDVVDLLKRQSA